MRFKNFISKLRNTYTSVRFDVIEEECPDKKLQYNQALHLIRILQEATGNALKHAGCSVITCEKKANGQLILFRITDDGRGFLADDDNNKTGNGLPNMLQRSQESGFGWVIISKPGEGTRIEVSV